jgi:hypothetical protein
MFLLSINQLELAIATPENNFVPYSALKPQHQNIARSESAG